MQNEPTNNKSTNSVSAQQDPTADAIVADLRRRHDDYMRTYQAETVSLRQSCLEALRQCGVETLEAEYSGCGDSGQVDNVSLEPTPERMPDGLAEQLDDLVWRVAYYTNPGFEINDGGSGEFSWSVADDSITIDHCAYYTAEDNSRHENV